MKSLTPSEINARLGAAIRARRVMLGMSQESVGKALGITFQQVQKYEKGTNQLGMVKAIQIAAVLGWTVIELLMAAFDVQPVEIDEVSERATMEFTKRFARLKPNERRGMVLLMNNLTEAA